MFNSPWAYHFSKPVETIYTGLDCKRNVEEADSVAPLNCEKGEATLIAILLLNRGDLESPVNKML